MLRPMSGLLTSPRPLFLSPTPRTVRHPSIRFLSSALLLRRPRLAFLPPISASAEPDDPINVPINTPNESTSPSDDPDPTLPRITDEWGEPVRLEAEPPGEPDAPNDEDEWGREPGGGDYLSGNGPPAYDKLGELKRCLVDTLYETELGFRATSEVRAEVLELVAQLEAQNPTPAPTAAPELLDGNWVLLYTAFSELLPLLAIGAIPLLKVKKISQAIDCKNLTILNATTLSSPVATFSFSASASFEVRNPLRIQVQFKEGRFQPPEILSTVDLPESIDILGQKINLSPLQQSLNPVQQAVANISRTISGQPPLRVPIPGERTKSWLMITYLDEDFRISRGDGGLFILAKEGSPLLDQLS